MNKEEQIEKAIAAKNERIDRCIDRKERGIAYFNSVNAAIQMAIADKSLKGGKQDYSEMLIEWRDWFYEQWCNWYIDTITPARIDEKRAVKLGNKWKKDVIEEANKKLQETVDEGRQREAEDKLNYQP